MKSFQNSRLILLLQSGSLVFLSVLLGILLMKSLWFCSLFTFFVILLFILHIDKQQQKLTEMVMRLITAIRFSDFSLSFRPGSKKQADPRLTQAMEQALKQFREKMYTLEEQHLYYNTLLSTILIRAYWSSTGTAPSNGIIKPCFGNSADPAFANFQNWQRLPLTYPTYCCGLSPEKLIFCVWNNPAGFVKSL